MIVSIISWVTFLVSLVFLHYAVRFFFELRQTSNQLLALASKEFFDAADSLMKSSDELPDEILTTVKAMLGTMNNGDGARTLLKIIRRTNSSSDRSDDGGFSKAVDVLRPELNEIYFKMVTSWMNFVTNRHVFYQLAITAELKKRAVRKHHSSENIGEAGVSILRHISQSKLAC